MNPLLIGGIVDLIKALIPKKKRKAQRMLNKIGVGVGFYEDLKDLDARLKKNVAKGRGVMLNPREAIVLQRAFNRIKGVFN